MIISNNIFLELAMNQLINNALVEQIKTLLEASRKQIAATVNTTLLHTYWQIGRMIVEDETLHSGDAEYEKQSLRQLSKALTTEFGKGFSRSNLSNMRQFYLTHKDVRTASGQLSWSHYCELHSITKYYARTSLLNLKPQSLCLKLSASLICI